MFILYQVPKIIMPGLYYIYTEIQLIALDSCQSCLHDSNLLYFILRSEES